MALQRYLPLISVMTVSEIQSMPGITGQQAIAEDTMVPYVFDGTNWIDQPLRKLSGKGAAPTINMLTGAGTGATGSAVGNNIAGTITIKTGLALTTDANIFTVSLSDSVSFPTKMIMQLQAADTDSLMAVANIFPSALNPSSVTIKARGLNLAASTTYSFNYQIMGY